MANFTKYILAVAIAVLLIPFLVLTNYTYTGELKSNINASEVYKIRSFHSKDGIGKFYMGREIAKVMGHQEMLWLERPSRESQEQPSVVIDALNLRPTDTVADIGAGTGYFSFRIAPLVPEGKVLAVDIQPEMIDVIDFLTEDNNVNNVETILGSLTDPKLPENSIDLALMVDVYHELEYPREMMESIVKALKTEGRVVLVEYRKENPLIPIKGLHKMTQKQVKKDMESINLIWQETNNDLPSQHLMVFQVSDKSL
ncbi:MULTISPECIES: class I SAM-dependent methyltransferase [Moorena]|uniref:Methylase involved in ubiquinone/menaquinone biosynthesis n=2 Tax=Moorena TaxID=1155738 RepID=F4XWP0_9CYAN|nr:MULTISPECIES: class I SAM-dependent methyltransferase [Moorena]EGJ31000.1 methylase involved in ubiquinone/menaquinone biosynthesis [Moorena producens 3L]NEP35014.1 class I SAM-dependent methyltransferase [Moorena sp. SIO3B2]NEP66047.1 class I SAM-dependent methyltransferase [Moorena sp. SIO3A5]NER87896.1 class I SAM-dependent methyltransferase [Moorena sp. SIO3A2]OLT68191.1 methyltransferase type 11 [Moorena producens 3L]